MLYVFVFGALIALIFARAMWAPAVVLAALFSIFAIKQWLMVSDPFFMGNRTVINFAYGGAIALIALIKLPACIKSTKHQTPVALLTIGLFCYAFLSLLWTPEAAQGGEKWLVDSPYILINIIAIPLLLRECQWSEFAKFQIFIGTIIALLLLFTVKWASRGLHLNSSFYGDETNPLEIAQLGAITGICAVYCPLKKNIGTLVMRLAVLGLSIILILKSGSRGQLISMAISILLVWLIVNGIVNFKKSVGLLIGAGLFMLVLDWGLNEYWQKDERFQANKMTDDFQGRLDMAYALMHAWADSPISIIMGLGNSAAFDPAIVGFYPHFLPLEILGEEGIVGFSVYISILLLTVGGIIKTTKAIRNRAYSPHIVGNFSIATGAWIYAFLLTLKQGNLIGNTIFFAITILIAATMNHMARLRGKGRVYKKPNNPLLAAAQPNLSARSLYGHIS